MTGGAQASAMMTAITAVLARLPRSTQAASPPQLTGACEASLPRRCIRAASNAKARQNPAWITPPQRLA